MHFINKIPHELAISNIEGISYGCVCVGVRAHVRACLAKQIEALEFWYFTCVYSREEIFKKKYNYDV